MASTYLSHQPSTGVSLATKATLSFWVKRAKIDSSNTFYGILSSRGGWNDGTGFAIGWYNDNLVWYNLKSSTGGYRTLPANGRKFRDCNAWYHIVYKIDTTQSAIQDRITLYVNGEDQGDMTFSGGSISDVIPNQNDSPYYFFQSGDDHQIGRWGNAGSSGYFDGSLSHFHFCDGTAYDASAFGSTDSTTGEWKINTSPSVTYGNNGFFILKDGNSGTDQSTNSNNWTVAGGTLTKTEDCPSNVFATLNPLSAGSDMAFTFGNTGIRNDVGTWNSGVSTLAMGTGKYYWEVYVHGGGDNNTGVSLSSAYGGTHSEVDAGRVVYSRNGYIYREGLSGQSNYSTGVTYGDGDYIGVAFDTENGVLTFYKNGSAVSNGSTTDTSFLRTNNEYIVQCGLYNGGEFRFNFGNGAFGSTQLTGTTYQGAGSNGIFKYQPPTGFTALSTKGLNL